MHAARPHADPERDAKIESLLLAGLDHYFSSDYAQAIDVWTRVLFFDRGHARARAYIERARTALAEQQRESDELLHDGIAAFERGEIEAARRLLNTAVQRGGAHEVALAFLTRIDRINAATPAAAAPVPARLPNPPAAVPDRRRGARAGLLAALIVLTAIAAAAYAVAGGDVKSWVPSFGTAADVAGVPAVPVQEPLAVPRGSEAAMARAQTLFATGHPYDALRALALVRPADPLRGDADRLKAEIQRELIAHHEIEAQDVP